MGGVRRILVLALLLGGCVAGPPPDAGGERLAALHDDAPAVRDRAFQDLLREGAVSAPELRRWLSFGGRFGFPVAALLYAQGRGDSVPLDLKARHVAGFDWPRGSERENALVEPYVREAIERDLVRAGTPALRPLARAIVEMSATEAQAMRAVRLMLRIGGRAAAAEFAALLDEERGLGGVRIGDVAAAALLYLGRQELAMRLATAAARLDAARAWWDLAKDFPESEWIRESVEALAAKSGPKDPEGVKPVFEKLVGRRVDDPKAWWEENRGWRPEPAPLRPAELLPGLGLDPARAYDANRRLEEATGARVFLPRMERASDLLSALRLWEAPPDLALRWRRWIESPLLRLSVAVIGPGPGAEPHRIRWAHEAYFLPVESDLAELQIETRSESYALSVQAVEFGTRLSAGESHGTGAGWTGTLREFRGGAPMVMFSGPFKAALVAVVEEVPARRLPPPPAQVRLEWRARLRSWKDSPDALRALGYFQEPGDRDALRDGRSGPGLLLLGDPASLDLRPHLEPHEIEMALRRASDPRVREYLEALRRGTD